MIIDGTVPASIDLGVQALLSDELIGLPTETVYGLASNAMSDSATLKIFSKKGRPLDHPLIAHVADQTGVDHFANEVPGFARYLMDSLWPGPLTLILNKLPGIAGACTGGAATIALRCPSHPVAQQVLRSCQQVGIWGLAAPSANRFGRVSPTTANHVLDEFGDSLLVLDGGPCSVGIESTIVDCTRGMPIILRPGILTLEEISRAARQSAIWSKDTASAHPSKSRDSSLVHQTTQPAPRASGTLLAHYAPNALVRLLSTEEMRKRLQTSPANLPDLAVWAFKSPSSTTTQNFHFTPMPSNPKECAKALFAQLRAFDDLKIAEIWVETPPQTPEWEGITDRLQRAAHSGAEPR